LNAEDVMVSRSGKANLRPSTRRAEPTGARGWNEVKNYPWILKEFIDLQEQWLIRNTPVATAASQVLRDRMLNMGRPPTKLFYVPNCVSAKQVAFTNKLISGKDPERKRALGLPDGPTILYTGHFDPADDVSFFCRAAVPVAIHHSDSGIDR
jgi:hypothetical protein